MHVDSLLRCATVSNFRFFSFSFFFLRDPRALTRESQVDFATRAAFGRQCWFAFFPLCLTLRAAYAAYRATALLLGSQPAPAGMFCFGFRFARFSFPPSAISASPREASLLLLCMLTRYSAALRLPPSLPLMSPFGLPAAGYPASARWHVFRFPVSGFNPESDLT